MSNEDVAKQFDDPGAYFQRLRTWGRITGYSKIYFHNDGCESQTGVRYLFIAASLYKTTDGAQQAQDWWRSYVEGLGDWVEPLDIGDAAYQIWFDEEDTCEPSDTIRSVEIVFRRYNALGTVRLGTVLGAVSDADMLSQAIDLAQLLDLRFIAEAKD